MQTLELENYGTVEMNLDEQKGTDGGSLWNDFVSSAGSVLNHTPLVYQAKAAVWLLTAAGTY